MFAAFYFTFVVYIYSCFTLLKSMRIVYDLRCLRKRNLLQVFTLQRPAYQALKAITTLISRIVAS